MNTNLLKIAAIALLALSAPGWTETKAEPAVPVASGSPVSSTLDAGSDTIGATLSPEESAKLAKVREERRKARKELIERLRNASPEEKARLRAKLAQSFEGRRGNLTTILSDSPLREGVKHSEERRELHKEQRKELRKELKQELRANGNGNIEE